MCTVQDTRSRPDVARGPQCVRCLVPRLARSAGCIQTRFLCFINSVEMY